MQRARRKIGGASAALAVVLSGAGALATSAAGEVVEATNPTPVSITKDGSCCAAQPASLYPSSINVTGAEEALSEVEVTLSGLHDSDAEGLEVLLVGPNGARMVLMASYEAGRHVTLSTTWSFLTFAQVVECPEPEGTFRGAGPTKPVDCGLSAPFPEPAPPGPYANRMEDLGSSGSNGEWKLYVANDASDGSGSIAQGWSLKLHLQPSPPPLLLGNREALEHAGQGAQEEYAQFQAAQRQAEQTQRGREASEREQAAPARAPAPCVVPALGGHSLAGARRLLARAHCRLGHVSVRRQRHKLLAVVHQSVAKGRHLASGAAVAIVLGVARGTRVARDAATAARHSHPDRPARGVRLRGGERDGCYGGGRADDDFG